MIDEQRQVQTQRQPSFEALNLAVLHQELDWFEAVITQVICSYLKHEGHEAHWMDIPVPDLDPGQSVYGEMVVSWRLDTHDRVALALVLAPLLRPELLDVFFGLNGRYKRPFSEFGGVDNKSFNGFIPTAQTLNFILSGNDPVWRLSTMDILDSQHILMVEQVLCLAKSDDQLPQWNGVLTLSDQWLHYFISGKEVRHELSAAFPAQPISTPLEWSDLVLDYAVMIQVTEIKLWITHGDTLMQDYGLAKKVKPGYRTLFFGPPGTGKTLTAALLAKSTGREIYRVDLSMVVSKYIGETEKNLAKVFDIACTKQWILFFDEADALFGQRTSGDSSNDRSANQQTAYLLQRIEDFPGVVILASNHKTNMDDAFSRRFQSMIHFAMPGPEQRLQLWQKAFAGSCELADDVDLPRLAKAHELAGGSIINVLRYCALVGIGRSQGERVLVDHNDLVNGLRREFLKENKVVRVV